MPIAAIAPGVKHPQDELTNERHHEQELLKLAIVKERVRRAAKAIVDQEEQMKNPPPELPTPFRAWDKLPEQPSELIPGLLLAHGANCITGEKETGKSLIALEMQTALLTGQKLWGPKGFIYPTVKMTRTCHILGEHSYVTLAEQLHIRNIPDGGQLDIYGPEHLGGFRCLVRDGIAQTANVERHKEFVKGAQLVVYDPIGSFIEGAKGENDNSSMRLLITTMIEIANSAGAALLVLSHMGKPVISGDGKVVKRETYATRGASSQEDAYAAVHYLEWTDAGKILKLTPRNYKGKKVEPFTLSYAPTRGNELV